MKPIKAKNIVTNYNLSATGYKKLPSLEAWELHVHAINPSAKSERPENKKFNLCWNDVVDVFLILFHATNVVLQQALLITWCRRMVAVEFRQFLPVPGSFVDNQLYILAELRGALLVVLLILSEFFKKIQAYFDKIFPYDIGFLYYCSISREMFNKRSSLSITCRMNYEVKVFRDEILAVIHRENTEKIHVHIFLVLIKFRY